MDGHYFFEKNPPWTSLLGPGRLLNFDLLPYLSTYLKRLHRLFTQQSMVSINNLILKQNKKESKFFTPNGKPKKFQKIQPWTFIWPWTAINF